MPSPVESDLPMRPAPEVSIAAIGETLPSQGLPVIGRREPRADRVARPVVGVLVAISLVAGVLLGWILARGL